MRRNPGLSSGVSGAVVVRWVVRLATGATEMVFGCYVSIWLLSGRAVIHHFAALQAAAAPAGAEAKKKKKAEAAKKEKSAGKAEAAAKEGTAEAAKGTADGTAAYAASPGGSATAAAAAKVGKLNPDACFGVRRRQECYRGSIHRHEPITSRNGVILRPEYPDGV